MRYPDITGKHPDYLIDNYVKVVMVQDQKLGIDATAFADSVNVSVVGTVSLIPLQKDRDWTIRPDDIDYDTMSQLKLIDPTFNKTIVKSITITKTFITEYKVNLVFQSVFMTDSTYKLYHDMVIEPTAEHMTDAIKRLEYLESITSPIDMASPDDKEPKLLEMDPSMTLNANKIENEEHDINVPRNKMFIKPTGGPFYKKSLKVVKVDTNTILTIGVDYEVVGLDIGRTRGTTTTDSIYRFILFLKPLVGTVSISYHAFGGDVTLYDARVMEEEINNILSYLSKSQFLTPDDLGHTVQLNNIYNKIAKMEDDMRRLCIFGTPSYGDVSNGGSLRKKIDAGDTEMHWWSIATLYKVDGAEDIITADTAKLRISTLYTKFVFDAIVTVNLNNPENERLQVSVMSPVYPKGYVPFVNYDGLNFLIRPQFRILWNAHPNKDSGVILQMGFPLKGYVEETIGVDDWSGKESCWKLVPELAAASTPEDNHLVLPNGDIWDKLTDYSHSESMLVPFPDGHIVWAGSIPLNRPIAGGLHFDLNDFLEDEIDLRKIRKMRFDLAEQGNVNYKYCVYVHFVPGSEDMIGSVHFSYNNQTAVMQGHVRRNAYTGKVDIGVDATIIAGVSANELVLRHVILFTND